MENNEKNINNDNYRQLKLNYIFLGTLSLFKTIRCVFICLGFVFVFYFLSGKTTIASLSAIVITSPEKVSDVYKYLAGGLFILLIFAIIWALIERRLRKTKVTKQSKRIVELEKKIDPNRSSSYLNKDGSTRKEDKHDV